MVESRFFEGSTRIEVSYIVHNAEEYMVPLRVRMGGALLQKLDRDTMDWAMKANAVCIDGQWQDVWKAPKTGMAKKSKRGRLALRSQSRRVNEPA